MSERKKKKVVKLIIVVAMQCSGEREQARNDVR
jgi:hypothetical protein